MKFNVTKTSDWKYHEQVSISTLEELMKFVDDNGEIIIIQHNPIMNVTGALPTIEIYDDYRE